MGAGRSPERLVRLLIGHAQATAPVPEERPRLAGSGVLLDIEIDGVRCLLLEAPAAPRRPNLSPREEEIARMVAEGYPNKTIAAKLNISSWTVSTYLRRIFGKLDVHSRTAMVSRLFEEDLMSDAGDARAARPEARADDPGRDDHRGLHAPRVAPRRGATRVPPARAGRRGDGV